MDNSAEKISNLIHSPSSGLIDIKPVYLAAINLGDFLLIILFISAILLFFYIIYPYLKNKLNANTIITDSPIVEFDKILNNIKQEKTNYRDFCEVLSYAIRNYIDRSLLSSTKTKTAKEAINEFNNIIEKKLPNLYSNKKNKLFDSFEKLLITLEELEYSNKFINFKIEDLIEENLSIASILIHGIEKEINKEITRRSSTNYEGIKNKSQLETKLESGV